eukprot:11186912-Lingulodinium_polyedra.AAC.1
MASCCTKQALPHVVSADNMYLFAQSAEELVYMCNAVEEALAVWGLAFNDGEAPLLCARGCDVQ